MNMVSFQMQNAYGRTSPLVQALFCQIESTFSTVVYIHTPSPVSEAASHLL